MYKIKFLIFLIICSVANNLSAQDKFEKESRIKQRDVPSNALFFMHSLNNNAKIKWYKEEALNSESIEAKFKLNKTKYSIEFDSLGNIEDVEIEVHWQDLDKELSKSITNQLKQDCSKHKIFKIQRQFTGTENDLFLLLNNGTNSGQINIKYEIIVRCNEQKEVNLLEYLFNETGLLVSKSKIIFKNSSHLEY